MSGAVTKQVEIHGSTYTLTAKFGTARLAEKEIGMPIPRMMQDVSAVGFDAISCLFWAFLQPRHQMTRDGSDNLVDEAGVEKVTEWVGECLAEYFGAGEDAGDKDVDSGKKPKSRKAG